jgi:hypothetical protein
MSLQRRQNRTAFGRALAYWRCGRSIRSQNTAEGLRLPLSR